MPTENPYVVGITRAIMRVMRFIQLQVTRDKAMPIKHLGILNGFLKEFLSVAQLYIDPGKMCSVPAWLTRSDTHPNHLGRWAATSFRPPRRDRCTHPSLCRLQKLGIIDRDILLD